MKPMFKFLICLVNLTVISANLAVPATVCASEPLVVGVPHSEAYTYANMMRNSFEMALETINKAGGVKGRPLKLVYANDQGKPKPGEKAIIELVEKNGAVMLVGAYQSSNTIFMARMADKLDRPESIRAALDKTDMMTPFGPVKFTSYENFERQNSLPTQVLQIINGKFECVWPPELATANFTAPPE